jgi:sodium transport system permease protein
MIFTIFKKELIDTLRDRRTLIMMLVIPILVFPLIMNVFVGISSSYQEEAATKELKIGIIEGEKSFLWKELANIPEALGKKKLIAFRDTSALIKALRSDSIDLGMKTGDAFEKELSSMKPAGVEVYFNGTDVGRKERAEMYLATIDEQLKEKRFTDLGIAREQVQPFNITYENIASNKEMIGKLAGGFLPYIFIAFGFIGCMYPAIDLFTGEKERGTIETLLTTPVQRWQILTGKMGVVVLSGLTASTFSLLGLFISLEMFNTIDNEAILGIIHGILTPQFILMLYGLLIPLTVFFAGVMIPIAVHAKTFKEAQSIITPMNIVMVLPAMVGFFPGIELNVMTACIPVVNVVLATKELIAGTLDLGLLALSFGVMIGLAVLAVIISYKRFDNESNVVI